MNNDYLYRAKDVIKDSKMLIILASKRARALAYGARPMVRCKEENYLDVALLEIAEGKLQGAFGDDTQDDFLKEIEAVKAAAGTDVPHKPEN